MYVHSVEFILIIPKQNLWPWLVLRVPICHVIWCHPSPLSLIPFLLLPSILLTPGALHLFYAWLISKGKETTARQAKIYPIWTFCIIGYPCDWQINCTHFNGFLWKVSYCNSFQNLWNPLLSLLKKMNLVSHKFSGSNHACNFKSALYFMFV